MHTSMLTAALRGRLAIPCEVATILGSVHLDLRGRHPHELHHLSDLRESQPRALETSPRAWVAFEEVAPFSEGGDERLSPDLTIVGMGHGRTHNSFYIRDTSSYIQDTSSNSSINGKI